MKAIVRRMLPLSLSSFVDLRREIHRLDAVPQQNCDTTLLRRSAVEFRQLDLAGEWDGVQRELETLEIGDKGGAVNPGDRRALYYLSRALKPRTILEIGTHLGASTSVLALALRNSDIASPRLTTVDILDVNGPRGAWARLGNKKSPHSMLRALNCDFVEFVVGRSIDFLRECRSRFDLVFLDGGHEATTVYQEVPAALKLLNPNGVILLHDFYPNCEPLWLDRRVVAGPWLAVERLRKEGVRLRAEPLHELPWPTKLDSRITSLACLIGT